MIKPMIRIHDLETNKIIDREMTDEEFFEYQAQQANVQSKETKEAAKADAKSALLTRLGITEDEAALLFS